MILREVRPWKNEQHKKSVQIKCSISACVNININIDTYVNTNWRQSVSFLNAFKPFGIDPSVQMKERDIEQIRKKKREKEIEQMRARESEIDTDVTRRKN